MGLSVFQNYWLAQFYPGDRHSFIDSSNRDINYRKRVTSTLLKLIQIFTSIHNNYCLTQLYFTRGDMFRLLIQPSSGQLTIEQDLLCGHNMGSHTVYI